jgi:PD-(D/E)XK endonuclease
VTTAQKGNTTEAAVLRALAERDFAVLVPFGEGHPYDLVVHLAGTCFARVQCKTGQVKNGCLVFNSRSTDHGRGAGTYLGLADLFGVYCPSTDAVYLVPVEAVPTSKSYLRIEAPRNNQEKRIRYAADYDLDRLTIEELCELMLRASNWSETRGASAA